MKKFFIVIISFLALGLLTFIYPRNISYAADSVQYESVNPDNSTNYFFKRFKEKVYSVVLTPFADKKSDYYKELVRRRGAELAFIANKKDLANIERASQRYASGAGVFTEYIRNKNLSSKKDDAISFLENQLLEIRQLRENFSDQTSEWRFMVEDYEYLQSYINSLK